ncbi:hypothetical protein A3D66_03205 [Candidatus Kaiserbacteria bacterium RIFCSPHIGHO2_02_FULL_50_9]|uniref:Uncharacterized protein n=1 Tax=Candidatus Kaiserbacteria bacterium RIFCSPLOWO2_01_FULL_51_21 TaxID=1798508 RepID=A0A1F6ECC3_9BACT|nr:MAG: hypothetical protein A2761_02960 [Candidatus Kaiserbacteria bacterium RIFCSPHIGHO2_01_FULL_51_33]OGG63743.1 MAG: hypothetical protein A3D66_03205 [Candidatus Kaiserbacteria bacterium RIFCSPHIGHO2_02_FULL_50_9]OGG71333.1 MAG: hypothetical protein A3A35_02250 [Candidatus Kaiserbacteria bacterium RIFCSPLOWO2_01_FULL_51_21]
MAVKPVSDEDKMKAYRNPEHLVEILNRGTGEARCLCDKYCGNKGVEGCQLQSSGTKPATYCSAFRLADISPVPVEEKIFADLDAAE